MQTTVETRESLGHTYAEPLSGLRVSWGSVLAGTVALLAVSSILWALAFGIVMLVAHPTAASFRGSITTLWICGICTTLVGAIAGGWVAGFLPGNPRRIIGAMHGFIAWGVALIVASVLQFATLGAMFVTATGATVQTLNSAVQTVGTAAGGAAGANAPLDTRAEQTLVSLGYTPEQARRMVADAQGGAQRVLQGQSSANAGQTVGGAATSLGKTMIDGGTAVAWTWFGTWALALLLAVGGGAAGASRLPSSFGFEERTVRRESPMPPLRPPVPST